MSFIYLECTKAAFVREDNPNTNYHGATKYRMNSSSVKPRETYLLLEFESLPEEYYYRNIHTLSLGFTCNKNLDKGTPTFFRWDTLESGFDEATVTWNSKPAVARTSYDMKMLATGTGDETLYSTTEFTNGIRGDKDPLIALKSPAFQLYCLGDTIRDSHYADVYAKAAASGQRPVLRVGISDENASVVVKKKNVNGADNVRTRFACNKESVFSWNFELSSDVSYPYVDVVQDSATFYWRKKGATSWNTRTVTGSSPSITVPANVLPAADIEWAVIPVCGNFRLIAATTDHKVAAYPRYFAEMPITGAAITRHVEPDKTIPWDSSAAQSIYHYYDVGINFQNDAYMMFSELPSSLWRRAIEAATIRHVHSLNSGWTSKPELYALKTTFNPERITWNNAPPAGEKFGFSLFTNISSAIKDASLPTDTNIFPGQSGVLGSYERNGLTVSTTKDISLASRDILRAAAFKISMPPGTWTTKSYWGIIHKNPAPVLLAMLLDEIVSSTVEGVTPIEGWIDPHTDQTFEFDHVPDGDYACAGTWESVSATLYWSDGNESHTVSVPANSKRVTLPADTLPVGTITWYVTSTDDQGKTSTSPTYTITTEDSETTAIPKAPVQTVEDARSPIVFLWETVNPNGTLPTGADLQISTDGTTWEDLGSVSGDATQFSAAVDELPSGTVYWRVRAYNADNVEGPWSAAVSFIAINSPPAPVVSVTAVPFATITWQAEGQQAYRVTVDGHVYGPFFGSAKTYTLEDFLENGGHTATVEIQNSTGLWSKPGSAIFSVSNIPGSQVELSGVFYRDAQLSWTTDSAAADFLVYRDGVRIAHTSGTSFTDRTVLGTHSWQVINRLPGGYYTASNRVQGELRSCGTAMALLNGGEWLELKKTDSESSEQNITVSQQISLRHFEGSIYPEAEVGPYIDQTGSYLVAWTYEEQNAAAAFEAMLGRPVILKARGNECTVGIMAGYAKRMPHFYKAYNFTLQRIHWEDFIDEDD